MAETIKIVRVYSVKRTSHDDLEIDLEVIDYGTVESGVQSRIPFRYRASDPYGELTPLITQWLKDNPDQEILPYIPPPELTPEELRELMPPISKRQLRLTLVRNGISLAALDTAILTMGDEAIIEWHDASEYRRLHPLLNQVAAHLTLSQEQVDVMWIEATTI